MAPYCLEQFVQPGIATLHANQQNTIVFVKELFMIRRKSLRVVVESSIRRYRALASVLANFCSFPATWHSAVFPPRPTETRPSNPRFEGTATSDVVTAFRSQPHSPFGTAEAMLSMYRACVTLFSITTCGGTVRSQAQRTAGRRHCSGNNPRYCPEKFVMTWSPRFRCCRSPSLRSAFPKHSAARA